MPDRISPALSVRLRPAVRDLVVWMVWLAAAVVALDAGLYLTQAAPESLRGLFDATSERGLGSWLSVTQATLVAVTLWVAAALHRPSGRAAGWAALAAIVSYLALDDGTRLHERIGSAFADSGASQSGLGAAFPSYYWQLVLGPVFAAMAVFMVVFLWRTFQTRRPRALLVGAFALAAVAVGLDFVDGLERGHPLDLYTPLAARLLPDARALALFGRDGVDAVVHLSRSVEESLEMVAATLLWAAILTHLADALGHVSVDLRPGPDLEGSQNRASGDGVVSSTPPALCPPPTPSTASPVPSS